MSFFSFVKHALHSVEHDFKSLGKLVCHEVAVVKHGVDTFGKTLGHFALQVGKWMERNGIAHTIAGFGKAIINFFRFMNPLHQLAMAEHLFVHFVQAGLSMAKGLGAAAIKLAKSIATLGNPIALAKLLESEMKKLKSPQALIDDVLKLGKGAITSLVKGFNPGTAGLLLPAV